VGGTLLGNYLANVWRLRYFWIALVQIDLRKRYRRSMLGLGWSLLHPIAMTVVICTVFTHIFHAEIRTFGPFLLVGLTIWNFASSAMSQGCQSFLMNESYIRQHPAPMAIYPLRVALSLAIHLVLGIGIAIVLSWSMLGFANLLYLPLILPGMALLFVFGWAIATITGVINVLFQDTQHLMEVVLQILFYLTPVIYPPSMLHNRSLGWVITVNPVAAFLEVIRVPIVEARVPSMSSYVIATTVTMLGVGLATWTLAHFERRMVFYL
jgi:ABC-type polysaccharide/polyol phosphate export permease